MKSKLQLMINGRPVMIPIELTDEQVRELTAAVNMDEAMTGWEEPQLGQFGYYENEYNEVSEFEITEETIEFAQTLYKNDNFFSTLETASNTIRADNVCRKLRHYAISHRKGAESMADGGYTITFNYDLGCLEIGVTGNWLAIGDVVFETEQDARNAMNKYASELIWYFTEGKAAM